MARRKEADLFSKHLFCCFRFVKRVWRQPGEEYKDKCVFPTVKQAGGSVMVWGCMSAAGTGELLFIEGTMNANMYCDILKQSMIPSLRRLGHRAVFQYDNYAKHTSKMTTALLKKLRVKVICGVSSNERWRSARSLTSTSSVMSSWRSGRGLQRQPVKLWWTPCPRGLRQCWKIMVATQNTDTLGPIWTFSLRGVLPFVASGLDTMAVCWVILRGQQNYTVIQAVQSLLYTIAKCHFFSVVTWKYIKQYLQKGEGCTHFCEILYMFTCFKHDKVIKYEKGHAG